MITVRTAGAEIDLAALGALFGAVGFRRAQDPDTLRNMIAGSWRCVAAFEGEVLVGFARGISDGVSNGYVSTVAVLPTHQRRGIGKRLMAELLAETADIKWVVHTSEAGEALYRGLGFVEATRMRVRDRAGPTQ